MPTPARRPKRSPRRLRKFYAMIVKVFTLARVAKLADARDLKSRVPKGTYRFNSGPGHQASLRRLKDFTVVLVFPNCPIGRVTSERFGCYSGPFCSRVNP